METLRQIHFQALEPEKIAALMHVINDDLGYQLARAVEQSKCTLSAQATDLFTFQDPPVNIREQVHRSDFDQWIEADLTTLAGCVDRLLTKCGAVPGDIDSVFLTGGSSFVPAVRQIFASRFGAGRLRRGGELTAVAKGLALRALSSL